MGRTRLARTRVAELERNITGAEERKKYFHDYLKKLHEKYSSGEISYSFYVETLHLKRDGRNIHEWIEFYDDYIKKCKRERKKHDSHLTKNQIAFTFLLSAVLLFFIALGFHLQPKILGFIIQEEGNLTAIANDSLSEEITGEIQNQTSPSKESLQTSENISEISEEQELNITEEQEKIIEAPSNITEIITNITEQNISQNETILQEDIAIIENATIQTIQFQAILNQKVKWRKTISSEEIGNLTITIPENSEKIAIKKIKENREEDITGRSAITGAVVGSSNINLWERISRLFKVTGRVVDENQQNENEIEVELEVDDINVEYEIEYETPAPYSIEEELENKKIIKIVGPETIHYTDVLAFTNLNENLKIKNPSSVKIKWVEQNSYINPIFIEDKDIDGIYDYVEWFVPMLSEQTFEIIVITKAEHLDSNRDFVSDIYPEVSALDEIWSEEIQENHFVRVTFERNLTSSNDITLFPRIVSGNPRIEVYEKAGDTPLQNPVKIAEFSSLNENAYNKVFLTNLGWGKSYDNETEILTEEGWKLFSELTKEEKVMTLNQETGKQEWKFPSDWPEFDNVNGKLYRIELEDGSEMRVSEKHKVYANQISLFNNLSINSEVVNTLTNTCSLKCLSFDQIEASIESDNARKSTSSGSGNKYLAFSRNLSYLATPTNLINPSTSAFFISNSCSESLDLDRQISLYLSNSDLINSGAKNSALINENKYEVTDFGSISEKNILLSNISFIFYPDNFSLTSGETSFNNLLNLPFLASLPILTDHSVNSFSSFDSILSFNANNVESFTNCSTTLAKATSNSLLNSKGTSTLTTISAINRENPDLYLNFSLMLITDAYSMFNDGVGLYFLDSNNNPIKIKSIEKVPYNDKIYGVDVENDIVLVKHGNGTPVWSGNSEGYSQDVFDLRVVGGTIQFDYIVDPTTSLVPTFDGVNSNQNLTEGYVTEVTYSFQTATEIGASNYALVNTTSNGAFLAPDGTGARDAYLLWNVTLPAYDSVQSVYLTAIVAQATTSGADKLAMALWNYNAGVWNLVNWTNKTGFLNGTLNYNVSNAANISAYILGQAMQFMVHTNGSSSSTTDIQVDYMEANVTYTAATDSTKPAISILFPTNLTNTTNILLNVNATYSDAGGLSAIWYNNDTNLAPNKSLGNTPTFYNITNITWSEGIHNVTVYVSDTAGNENWTSVTFMIDSVKPAVEILNPTQNNSNSSNTLMDVNFTFSDLNGITNTWYANDTYSVLNKSLGGGGTFYNITNLTWSEGKHNVTVYVNDSFGNVNFTTISFTVDATNPSLSILVPEVNNTNTSNTNQNINFTFFDSSGIAEVWYNNDTLSVANKSLGKDGTFYNITNITWSSGKHNVTIYVNDSAGNINYTSFSFTVDTIIPTISIQFPTQNNTNNTNTLDVNFTAADSGSGLFNFWYNNDTFNIANKSLGVLGTSFNITNLTWGEGLHNVTIWANDSAGNYNFASISFRIDSVNPDLTILIPEVNQTNTSNINQNVNFTFFDLTGIDSVWYNNDTTSVANKSLGSAGTYFNITNLTWENGKHNVTIYVNDSAGNLNYTSFSFTVDTLQPDLDIVYPTNNSVVSDVNADVNYTRIDVGSGLFNCWYSNDTYLVNTTLSSCENITTITWEAGAHNITVWANDSAGNFNRTTINFSILANTPPEIREIFNNTASIIAAASGINSGPVNTSLIVNFSVYDAQGVGNMNNATATINFSRSGEALRQNSTCFQFEVGTNVANYTCNVTMQWYDQAGTWAIQAFISDLDSNDAKNNSANFSVGETTGFELGSLSFPFLSPGLKNQTSTAALRLNNTGNKNMTANTTQINATNLRGEVTPTTWIFAGNLSVSWDATSLAACDWSNGTSNAANKLANNTFINITVANLSKGYYPTNDGNSGQEDFYFCIRTVGSELTSQSYSTLAYGPWQVRILLAFVAIPRKRKINAEAPSGRKKRQKKKIEDDKLIEILETITEEIKEKYRLDKREVVNLVIKQLRKKYKINRKDIMELAEVKRISIPATIFSEKIGILESLVKYMKENLNMSYSEIAQELGRNDRTIWTAYKKAVGKQKERIEEKDTDINLPISIFNKEMTILESIVIYLKEKGMKYSEIGKLLGRDQRNIWTIYSRAMKKDKQ